MWDALAQVRATLHSLEGQVLQLSGYVDELAVVGTTEIARTGQQARAVELRRNLRQVKAEADRAVTVASRNPPQQRGLFGFWARAVPPDAALGAQYEAVVRGAQAAYDAVPVRVAASRGEDVGSIQALLDQVDPPPAG